MTPAERDAADGRFALALMQAGDLNGSETAEEVERVMEHRLSSATRTVPLLRPGYVEPVWLAKLADVFRRVELALAGQGPRVLATFSGPAQTGKSAFVEVAMARLLAAHPRVFMATVSYGADLTLPRSRRIRDDVQALGVELRGDSQSVEHWATTDGGGLIATGIRGPLTGQPGLGLVVGDDWYKDAGEAESRAYNRDLRNFVSDVVLTRLGARTSVVIMFARWATDDVIGWLQTLNLPQWEHHKLPLLDEHGEPIPKIPGKDRAFYESQRDMMERMHPGVWHALMMGDPPSRDGIVFLEGPPTYRDRPAHFERIAIGIDFAYSKKKSADHNAYAVVGMTTAGRAGYYVLEVKRRQCGVVEWSRELRSVADRFPSATLCAYIGAAEQGATDGIEEIDKLQALARGDSPIRIKVTTTRQDKVTRAQPTAAKWNGNQREVAEAMQKLARRELVLMPAVVPRVVYMPEQAGWDLRGFLDRTKDFTGAEGGIDDEQDALVAACDECGPLMPHVALTQPGRLERSVW